MITPRQAIQQHCFRSSVRTFVVLIGFAAVMANNCASAAIKGEYLIDVWHPDSKMRQAIDSISQTADGYLWIGSGKVTLRFDGIVFMAVTNTSQAAPDTQRHSAGRITDVEGNSWSSEDGHLVREAVDGSLTSSEAADGLPKGRITALYEDREHNLWVGTQNGGLARLRKRRVKAFLDEQRDGLLVRVTSLLEDASGTLWAGTYDHGLYRLTDHDAKSIYLSPDGSHRTVTSLGLDNRGTIWIGSIDFGLYYLENGTSVSFDWKLPDNARYYAGRNVHAILQDSAGAIWFGTSVGLFCLRDGVMQEINDPAYDQGSIRTLAEDTSGRLWVGMRERGAGWFKDGKFTACDLKQSGTLHAYGLHADRDGTVWIASNGDGLWRWRDGNITHYTTDHGLRDNHLFSIAEDRLGNLWLGSAAGILRVTKSSLEAVGSGKASYVDCILFDESDGLPSVCSPNGTQRAILEARDGRLWFAMMRGLVMVTPDEIRPNPLPPPVILESIRVDHHTVPMPRRIDESAPEKTGAPATRWADMKIPPGSHLLEFGYTATSLVEAEKIHFKYRLEGFDHRWQDAGRRRSATYTALPPGDYRFRVIACNNDGLWNEVGASIGVTIPRYFWETRWFPAVVLTCLMALVLAVREYRTRRLREVDQLRLRIAHDLHDHVGSNLGSIHLLSELAERQSPAPSREDLAEIRDLAVETMETLRETVWFIDPGYDRLDDLLTRMKTMSERMLSTISHSFDVRSGLDGRTKLSLPFRRHVFPMFKEILHNIVKHARATRVQISVSVHQGDFYLQVEDNGIGFDRSAEQAGNGLRILQQRAAEIGASLDIESRPGSGTRIHLWMRIK